MAKTPQLPVRLNEDDRAKLARIISRRSLDDAAAAIRWLIREEARRLDGEDGPALEPETIAAPVVSAGFVLPPDDDED